MSDVKTGVLMVSMVIGFPRLPEFCCYDTSWFASYVTTGFTTVTIDTDERWCRLASECYCTEVLISP